MVPSRTLSYQVICEVLFIFFIQFLVQPIEVGLLIMFICIPMLKFLIVCGFFFYFSKDFSDKFYLTI